MPYLVHAEKPEQVSWSQFIREPYEIKKRFVIAALPAFKASKVHPTSEKRAFGDFFIHLGRYDIDPIRNQYRTLHNGLPVAATLDGELVGAISAFNLWVHPACLRRGLAIEMAVDRFRYTGGARKEFSSHPSSDKPMRYTPEGFNALKATYRELVKRGLIDPGPTGCPT